MCVIFMDTVTPQELQNLDIMKINTRTVAQYVYTNV